MARARKFAKLAARKAKKNVLGPGQGARKKKPGHSHTSQGSKKHRRSLRG